jgi:hypothetical protein
MSYSPSQQEDLQRIKKLPAKTQVLGGRSLVIREDGTPMPTYSEPITIIGIKEQLFIEISKEYEGEYDPEFECKTMPNGYRNKRKIDAAITRQVDAAAAGDQKAFEIIMNYTIGRPKQAIESVQVSMTYQDYLQNLVDEENYQQEARHEKAEEHHTQAVLNNTRAAFHHASVPIDVTATPQQINFVTPQQMPTQRLNSLDDVLADL